MKKPKQGEILLLLTNRSGIPKGKVAELLNVDPSHLSNLFKSELLTTKVKKGAMQIFGVDESIFDISSLEEFSGPMVSEPSVSYFAKNIDDLNAGEVFRYLEEKDNRFEEERVRHHEERVMLLNIIENLTKK